MKKFLRLIQGIHLGLGCLLFTFGAQAQIKPEEILTILKTNGVNPSEVTMEIRQKDKVVFGLNEKMQLIPASVTKIFTTFAVLKQIPFNYKFKTELYFDDKNIYVKGGGDPAFVSENMWYLVNEFKRQGISHIPGDIILDDSLFDEIRYDQSRESKRIDRSYDAPVGALSFNWNSVNIYIKPEAGKVQAYVDPESNYFTLRNTAKVSKKPKDLILSIDQDSQVITVSGELSSLAPEKAYFKNVSDPIKWFGENLKSFLNQRGVSIKGKIKPGKVPASARLVATNESKTLSAILSDMNKFSNNFVAEMLTKNLAAYSGEAPAKLSTGVGLIKSELRKLNLIDKDLVLLNPSGFSRDNKFSAHALTEVLAYIQTDFKIYPSFVDSLPLAGYDGTLKKRMKDSAAEGYVRAKTGYLDGVVSLAGYAAKKPLAQNDVYAFTFIYNGAKDEAAVRATFDKILNHILN